MSTLVVVPTVAAQQTVAATHADDARTLSSLLARRVSITLHDVSLIAAIDSLSRTSGVTLQYRLAILEAYPKTVSVRAENEPLGVVLERVLDGTGLRVIADGRHLALVTSNASAMRDSVPELGVLAGVVVDSASGRGVNGVTVRVLGTKFRVVTQDSGRFSLSNVPAGDHVLSFRLFGYRPIEQQVTVAANERAVTRAALAKVPNVLAGVVTTATGIEQRRSIGQDITTINVDSVMRTAPIRSVTDLLESRVPGLTVQRTSGVPGAPSRIRLRGIGGGLVADANSTNDPIVVVNGIRVYARTSTERDQNTAATTFTAPSALDQIDPNSIEKIDVLKGPSASSLYGPDAANGVIVITTKRGRAGPPLITGHVDGNVEYMPGRYAGPGYYNFGHEALLGGGSRLCGGLDVSEVGGEAGAFHCVIDSLVAFQALNVPRLSPFGTGNSVSATVNASGGSPALTYALTASASTRQGYLRMPEFFQDRYTFLYKRQVPAWMKRPGKLRTWGGTGTFTNNLFPTVLLRYTTSLATSTQDQSSGENQLSTYSSRYIDTTRLSDGLVSDVKQFALRAQSRSLTSNNSLATSISRWSVLPTEIVVGLSTSDREDVQSLPSWISGGNYSYGRPTSQTRTANLTGTLFPRGRVVTSLGMNVIREQTHDFLGIADTLEPGIAVPAAFARSAQSTSILKNGGWFVAPRINLGDRFFAAPGFRLDNNGLTSGNGRGGVLALLPKMDFSWVAIDREGQAPFLGIITLLRPRIAFGSGGVQPDPRWRMRLYALQDLKAVNSADTVPDPIGILYPGLQLQTVGNPILRAERTRELEGGADFQLWENRVTMTVTGYSKLRFDAIEMVPLAPSAGGLQLTQFRNIGKVRNSGTELQLTVVPLQNASTTWTLTSTYSANRNRVLAVTGAQSVLDLQNGIRIVPGYPLDGRWGRPIVGFIEPGLDSAGTPRRVAKGDIVLGDSVTYLGSATPRYHLPIQTSLTMFGGAVGISLSLDYQAGTTQSASGNLRLLQQFYLDPAASLGQQAAALAAFCPSDAPKNCTDAGVVQTVNTFRVQSLSVNYRLPRVATRRWHLPATTVMLQGSNLVLRSSYRGKDPNVNSTPIGEALTDNGAVPLPRTWGLQFSFGQ